MTASMPPAAALQERNDHSSLFFVLLFFLLCAGFAIIGYVSYANYERQFRHEVEEQLSAIADLKVNGLKDWRAERIADAEILRRSPAFAALAAAYFEDPADAEAQQKLQAWLDSLKEAKHYDRVMLLDSRGVERLASPTEPQPLAGHLPADAAAALASGEATFLDFHRNSSGKAIYLAVLAPIYARGDRSQPLGVVVLRINPETTLYPYLRQWPVPSETAETLLVRREGDTVLFLNPLRFQPDAALNLRIPLTEEEVLAVKAVKGFSGSAEGKDYRGKAVVGNVRPVPGSPWFLVARMDTDEVYAPLLERLWNTAVFFVLLTATAGAGLALLWRQQRVRYYQSQVTTLETLRLSEDKFRVAFDTSPDSIVITRLDDGRFVSVNKGFEQLTGYRAEEVIGKSSLEIEIWEDPQDRQRIVAALQAHGRAENFEARFRTRSGQALYGLMSAAVIYLNGEAHILNITRDITARKQAEEKLKKQNEFLLALQQTTLELLTAQDLHALLQDIVQRAGALMGTSSGFLDLIDEENRIMMPQIGIGALQESLKHPVQKGEGVSGRVWQTGEPVVIHDYDAWPGRIARFAPALISSVIGVPLKSGEQVLGVLGLGYEAGDARKFDASAIEDLAQFAHLAALAIEKTRLLESLQRELTERRQTEAALRARENLLNKIIDILPIGLWLADKDGKLIRSNAAGRAIWGAEPLVGQEEYGIFKARRLPSGEEIAPDDWALAHTVKEGAIVLGEMLEIEAFDGQRKVILNYTAPVLGENEQVEGAVVVNLDITEWVRTENLVRARLRLYEFAERHSFQEVLVKTIEEVCELTSSSAGFFFSVDPDEQALALQVWSSSPAQDNSARDGGGLPSQFAESGAWSDCLRQRKAVINNDASSPSASAGWPEGLAPLSRQLAAPVFRQDKIAAVLAIGSKPQDYTEKDVEVVHYFADMAWEINERKQFEAALQEYSARLEGEVEKRTRQLVEMQEQLLRQERLATLGQIAGSVAHELRNPLGIISNAVYYLRMILPQPEARLDEYLGIIEAETRGAEKIVADLVKQARIRTPVRRQVSVQDLVRRAFEEQPPPPNIGSTIKLQGDLPLLYVDPGQIVQVLGNLLINAYQAMPEGGVITLSAQQRHQQVMVSVEDNGIGIEPEHLPRVFEPLFTTKVKGIGLGLSLARNLVEVNGGRIEVQSEPGKGSQFTVYLPAASRAGG